MSWLGTGFSSITDQISSFTKEVLNEGEVDDPDGEVPQFKLGASQGRQQQDSDFDALKIKSFKLKSQNDEMREKLDAAELQNMVISRKFRQQLSEKEEQLRRLEAEKQALIGCDDHDDVADEASEEGFRAQFFKFKSENQRLRAQLLDIRKSASQTDGASSDAQKELVNIKIRLQESERALADAQDRHQRELSALQDAHGEKLSSQRHRNKQHINQLEVKVQQLQDEKAVLRQQLNELPAFGSHNLLTSTPAKKPSDQVLRRKEILEDQDQDQEQDQERDRDRDREEVEDESLRQRLEQSQLAAADLQAEKEALEQVLLQLRADNKRKETSIAALRSERGNLSANDFDIVKMQEENALLLEVRSKLEEELLDLRVECDRRREVPDEADKLEMEISQELEKMRLQLKKREAEKDDALKLQEQLRKSLEAADADRISVIEMNSASMEELKREVIAEKSEKQSLAERILQLERDSNRESILTESVTKSDENLNKIEKMEAQIEELQSFLTQSSKEAAEQSLRLEEVSNSEMARTSELQDAQMQVEVLLNQKAEIEAELLSRNEEMNRKLQEAEEELNERVQGFEVYAQQMKAAHQQEIANLHQQMQEIIDQYMQLQSILSGDQQLSDYVNTIEDLKTKVKELSEQAEQQRPLSRQSGVASPVGDPAAFVALKEELQTAEAELSKVLQENEKIPALMEKLAMISEQLENSEKIISEMRLTGNGEIQVYDVENNRENVDDNVTERTEKKEGLKIIENEQISPEKLQSQINELTIQLEKEKNNAEHYQVIANEALKKQEQTEEILDEKDALIVDGKAKIKYFEEKHGEALNEIDMYKQRLDESVEVVNLSQEKLTFLLTEKEKLSAIAKEHHLCTEKDEIIKELRESITAESAKLEVMKLNESKVANNYEKLLFEKNSLTEITKRYEQEVDLKVEELLKKEEEFGQVLEQLKEAKEKQDQLEDAVRISQNSQHEEQLEIRKQLEIIKETLIEETKGKSEISRLLEEEKKRTNLLNEELQISKKNLEQEIIENGEEKKATCNVETEEIAALHNKYKQEIALLKEALEGTEVLCEENKNLMKSDQCVQVEILNQILDGKDHDLQEGTEKKDSEIIILKEQISQMEVKELELVNNLHDLMKKNEEMDILKEKLFEIENEKTQLESNLTEMNEKNDGRTIPTESTSECEGFRAQKKESSDIEILNERISELELREAELKGNLCEARLEQKFENKETTSLGSINSPEMQRLLSEKDEIIGKQRKDNANLMKLLESQDVNAAVTTLQKSLNEVQNEREQIMSVLGDKARECSSLKGEVQHLMSAIAAERAALQKLKQDNSELQQTGRGPPDGEEQENLTKEAVKNMARLVRDKEQEIDALTRKNETLMQVLQEGSGSGSANSQQLKTVLAERDSLATHLQAFQADREQIVTAIQSKHAETLNLQAALGKVTAEKSGLIDENERLLGQVQMLQRSLEDKQKFLLKSGTDNVELQQKLTMMESSKNELILKQQSSELCSERILEMEKTIKCQEEELIEKQKKLFEADEQQRKANDSMQAYKKQAEATEFTMKGVQAQLDYSQNEIASLGTRLEKSDAQVASLQEKLQYMATELAKGAKAASVGNNDSVETPQATSTQAEFNQLMLECNQLQQKAKSQEEKFSEKLEYAGKKENKLNMELTRLREHLMTVEDGYTQEAVQAKERESELRNRLAVAEESAMRSAKDTAVKNALLHQEDLQRKLEMITQQRDKAVFQHAKAQEMANEYAAELTNLQMVLEQFEHQRRADTSLEVERARKEFAGSLCKIAKLEEKISFLTEQLNESQEALRAAERLSEQLDRKTEAINALKEEVLLRETELKKAETEAQLVHSHIESKIDKMVVQNLFLSYFTTPPAKRPEVLKVIAKVLELKPDQTQKITEIDRPGWFGGIFKKATTPSQSVTSASRHQSLPIADKSFSELFVKFLESESTPAQLPHLPAERMAAEQQQKAQKPVTTFNPFNIPQSQSLEVAPPQNAQQHLLMKPIQATLPTLSSADALFSTSSGTILKDLLQTP